MHHHGWGGEGGGVEHEHGNITWKILYFSGTLNE